MYCSDVQLHILTQHGTMILSMEDLSSKMAHHPRYWERLITVLSKTIEREDTPGLIIQV